MKIICIGQNYSDHIKELNSKPSKEPMFFLKPDSAILLKKHPFVIPEFTNEVHYEVELLIRINKLGKYIQPKFAHKYYDEIGLGIDFTARDLQRECKEKGHPWEKAKGFDGSAVLGDTWVSKENFKDLKIKTYTNGIRSIYKYCRKFGLNFRKAVLDLYFNGAFILNGSVYSDDKKTDGIEII